MTARTFAIGDIHGDLAALRRVMGKLPSLTYEDTLVFVGDYLDRGPNSAQVIEFILQNHYAPKTIDSVFDAIVSSHFVNMDL